MNKDSQGETQTARAICLRRKEDGREWVSEYCCCCYCSLGLPAARNDKTTQKPPRLTSWSGLLENGGGERSSRETRWLVSVCCSTKTLITKPCPSIAARLDP